MWPSDAVTVNERLYCTYVPSICASHVGHFLDILPDSRCDYCAHLYIYPLPFGPIFSADKEQLIRYKFRWAEADDDPQDNQLNMDEFKSFRHPEQSRNMLTKMVQDILDNLGKMFTLF